MVSILLIIMNTYQQALTIEDNIRDHFNDSNCSNDPMRTDSYYNLIEINSSTLETFATGEKPVNVLFKPVKAIPQSWRQTKYSLSKLDYLMNISNLFIAGGRVYSSLFGTETNDIDIFIWGLTQEQAYSKAEDILTVLIDKYGANNCTLIRTANAISINTYNLYPTSKLNDNRKHIRYNYQIILRLYHSPSEILHGFDIDSCCVGYDGKKIWATQRAMFAFINGYNTINFDRMSPSYENRLVKYATRGMSIYVPDLNPNKIEISDKNNNKDYDNMNGLDILIDANMYWSICNYEPSMYREVLKLLRNVSDYGIDIYLERDIDILTLKDYMIDSSNKYPKFSQKYLPYLKKLDYSLLYTYVVMNPFKNKDIPYIKINMESRLSIQDILTINSNMYEALNIVGKWGIPQIAHFKESNPGEQMTNTFNKTIIEDKSIWYNGCYYKE